MSRCIFILGTIDKKLLIPLLLSIVYLILNIYEYFYPANDSNIFIDYFGYSLGQISALIIPKIFKIKRNTKKSEKKCAKGNIKDYFFLILIGTLLAVIQAITTIFMDKESIQLCIAEGFQIIIIFFITLLFMKYKYYIHHIISLIIFVILSIVIDIMLNNIKKIEIETILTETAYGILESTCYCYIKYMMETKYHYYWNILFFLGITNLIINSSAFFVLFSIKKSTNNPDILKNIDYYSKENIGEIIIRFLIEFIFYGIIYNILEMETLSKLTLNHIFACYEISKIPGKFIGIEDVFGWFSIIPALLQVIILLFYLEIFEYNFCDLNINTKRNIQERERADILNCTKDDNDKDKLIEMIPGYYIDGNDININSNA